MLTPGADRRIEQLRAAGVPSPEAEWRWIRRLAPERADEFVEARCRRVPLQHLLGTVAFRHIELLCDGRALIPRPETEITTEVALAALPQGGRLLDVGTGSGCIALSVKHERPDATVVATDIDADALQLAATNAARLGLEVDFRHGDLFAPVAGEAFDVIVSNPPYLALHEIAHLEPEVRDHDPRCALVAGPNGLEILERIIVSAPGTATLVLEIAPHQAGWARRHGEVTDDLGGRPRVLKR